MSRDPSQIRCKITEFPVYPVVQFEDRGEDDREELHYPADDDNLALGRPADQSSTADPEERAERATDGNPATCIRSSREVLSWWRVDLGETHNVQRVVVSLLQGPGMADIDGAGVHVGSGGDYIDPLCGARLQSGVHENYELTRTCSTKFQDLLPGRFVTVERAHRNLAFCEVRVYAHDPGKDCVAGTVKCNDNLCKPPSFC